MGDLTKNLSRSEFECTCGCGFDTVDYELVDMIQRAVDHFEIVYNSKVSVVITGPNRCMKSNERVQKEVNPNYVPYSSKSTHMEAKAADIKMYYYVDGKKEAIPPKMMYTYFDEEYAGSKGVGLYSNRVHVDSRSNKARWGV